MLVHDLFERSRRLHPERIAVTRLDQEWSYERLGRLSDQFATVLGQSAAAGQRVGVWMRRTPECIASMLGTWKAAACVVPLDPDAPDLRVKTMLEDCGIRTLIVDQEHADRLQELLAESVRLDLVLSTEPAPSTAGVKTILVAEGSELPVELASRACDVDLAQLLYTSGSTGRPKGVMLSHRNILDFVSWAVSEFGFEQKDQVLQVTPFFFDISICDLHATFAVGATLHLATDRQVFEPPSLVALVTSRAVTFWFSVPRVVSWMAATGSLRPGIFPNLRAVLFGGEPLPPKHLATWIRAVPQAIFVNMYGPTETTVASTYAVFTATPADLCAPLTIGKPRGNAKVLILGEHDRVCGIGEEGEICIGGTGVMHGYFGRPDLTASVLVQNPQHHDYPDLLYRTGDFGAWDASGNIAFRGRRDAQVKIGGVRSELGEIESALASHPAVNEAVVLAVPDGAGNHMVVGYYTASAQIREESLWEHLEARLSRVMLPRRLQRLDQMPRLPNGKVDRQRCLAE